MIPGHAPDGGPILSVLAKMTYRYVNGEIALEDTSASNEWLEVDQYWGANHPATNATKLESDLVAGKP